MSENALAPGLYLVPTPIGNIEDITLRALKVLSEADIVACEDTRHTGNLFKMLNIRAKKFDSFHEHNEIEKAKYLADEIAQGKSIALVSDAGSPAISDPGYRLVNECVERGLYVTALPGATAFVPALTGSGFAVHNFAFFGFAPQKKGRQTFLKNVLNCEMTSILYESTYRIEKLIEEIIEYGGAERSICIAREITKLHEEFIRGTAAEVKNKLKGNSTKGEFVVIIEKNKME